MCQGDHSAWPTFRTRTQWVAPASSACFPGAAAGECAVRLVHHQIHTAGVDGLWDFQTMSVAIRIGGDFGLPSGDCGSGSVRTRVGGFSAVIGPIGLVLMTKSSNHRTCFLTEPWFQ